MSVFSNPADAAKEQAEAYVNAVLGLLEDREPVSVLEQTVEKVQSLTKGHANEVLRTPEFPGKWSVVQVVQHFADSEVVWAWRLRSVAAQDRAELTGFDQDAWASELNYAKASLADAVEQFRVMRIANLKILKSLTPLQLQRVGVHKERGEESIEYMIRLYAGHDLVHLRQISRIIEGLQAPAGKPNY